MLFVTAVCGVLTLGSCTGEVMNLDVPSTGSGTGQSQLRVTTRGEGKEAFESRLYVFNAVGQCVQLLAPDADQQFVTTDLSADTYDLYGIGSAELSHFELPTADNAMPTTEISVAAGQKLGDLLIGHETITLKNGDSSAVDIQLERKVSCVTSITIHEVPDDVEQVRVSVAPMYRRLLLNGTLDDASGTYTVDLSPVGDGDWMAEPHEVILPSKTRPTITISFIIGETTKSYTYESVQSLKANTNVTLEGTFVGAKGVALSATMTPQSWDAASRDIAFDFDEYPIAGQKYQGYFVVSNDPFLRKATLLVLTSVSYTAPTTQTQTVWLAALQTAMDGLAKPAFAAATDQWRLPTVEECQMFSKNTDYVMQFNASTGSSTRYFCMDHTLLKWGRSQQTGNGIQFFSGNDSYQEVLLRPVIDIAY